MTLIADFGFRVGKKWVYIDPHVKDVYIEDTFVLYLCRICVSDTVFLIFILTHADRHPSNDTMHNCTYTYYNVVIIYTSSLISYTFAVGFGPIKCKLLTLVMPGAPWGFKHVHSSSLGVEHVPMCHLFLKRKPQGLKPNHFTLLPVSTVLSTLHRIFFKGKKRGLLLYLGSLPGIILQYTVVKVDGATPKKVAIFVRGHEFNQYMGGCAIYFPIGILFFLSTKTTCNIFLPKRNLLQTALWMGWLYPPVLSLAEMQNSGHGLWGTPNGPFLYDLWKIEAFVIDQTGVSKFLDLELWWFPAGIKQFVGILRVPNSWNAPK